MIKVYIKKINDKYQAKFGLDLAKYAINDTFNIKVDDFKYNLYGKPHIDNENIFFNISHKEAYVVCVVSDIPCGIDIEKIIEFNMLEISKQYFNKDEYKIILNANNPFAKFYELWTIKESYLKCKGYGLTKRLDDFTIKNNVIYEKKDRAYFKIYDFDPLYKLTVCSLIDKFNDDLIFI